jgi:hypothetical protein
MAVLFLPCQLDVAGSDAPGNLFDEVERIELKMGDVVFASVADARPLPDGFILIIDQSAFGDVYSIVKLSKKGELIRLYDKRGNGPGEIRRIDNIAVRKNSILVAESTAPFVHEYSHDLQFIKDHRVKKGGKIFLLGKFVGIWSTNFIKENNQDKSYILALYDSETFEFKRYAFEIPGAPAYVFSWGNVCELDNQTFAGIYSTRYQVHLFDSEFNRTKDLIKNIPKHIKKYYPWKQDPHKLDNTGIQWMHSWSKIYGVYYIKGTFIIKYMHDKKRYLDLVDGSGNIILAGFEEAKNSGIIFTQDSFVWWLESNDDKTKFFLVKTEFNLKAAQ